ncbi:cell elongation-specific peptidoglycan biosynthesis regulator RodA [Lentzea atacamensis]|uniref:Cell elongation-specific peptidoglycan biosynthesis regulator RodA n=2 Tax=Lentzea TaxID=165301 RepID=A0A316ID10_9PSEU|nr:FtsW/RodA/SpoVE family cell cycle protein [Lentzea atacamensis]PWK90723.1 cell elongation-specific peptidoglycan biosynthesis regulator RodA [Lentzea atacamensis]RAS68055.1 cell elongation-specific peptidoglycan biosynthesis regulator RodA [Lentzea atacamensis]
MGSPVPVGEGSPGASVATSTSPGLRAPTRRGTELVMLAFAAGLVTLALILVELNQERSLSLRILYLGLAYLGLFACAHLAVRRWAPYADPAILPCVALLNGLGLVVIHRIDLALEGTVFPDGSTWDPVAFKQVIWTAIGLLLFAATLKFLSDHRTLARFGYTFGLVGLVALMLPGVLPGFIAPEINGAKIWLRIGPLSIQPGEFAKILLMVFFAAFLVSKRDLFTTAGRRFLGMDLPRARDLGPLFAAWGVTVAVMVLQKDLGSSLLFFGIVLVLLYVATERAAWVVLGLGLFTGGAIIAWKLFTHVQQRVANWQDPISRYDLIGGGYQISQSLFGLATGGIGGAGLGAGRPEMIPEANTDFITAVIGEELGFVGFAALLLIYMIFALRGLRSAIAVRDSFGKLLGGGLAFAVCFQVFIVVGGVTKLIPMTGITAPFLSYGGSSLLANYILVALLLRISAAARAPQRAPKPKPQQPAIADQHTVMVERPK